MKRKLTCLSIMALLILASTIVGGCGCNDKLDISIKIESTASTWRAGEQPYDIYGAIEQELEEAGFDVVSPESTSYDARLLVDYREEMCSDDIPSGQGTDITCELTLYDETGDILFKYNLSASTPEEATADALYSSAIDDLEDELYLKYLGEIIATEFGIGDEISVLATALEDEDEDTQTQAVILLSLKGEAGVEFIIQALDSEYEFVRFTAVMLLSVVGNNRAIEPLFQAVLNDESPMVRLAAATNLGVIGEPAIEYLIYTMKTEGDEDIRMTAAATLVLIGEDAIEPLIQTLGYEDEDVRALATEALVLIGEEAVEPLIQTLGHEDEDVRALAAATLVLIGEEAVEPLIYTMKTEGDMDIRMMAAATLVLIGEDAIEPLIQALKDENWLVRQEAAWTLGMIGDARAVEPLIQALKDEEIPVQLAAEEALKEIRGY